MTSSPASTKPLASASSYRWAKASRSPFVSLLDDGAIDRGRELLKLAVVIVDPHLDDVGLLVGKPIHPRSSLRGGGHLLRHTLHAGDMRRIAPQRREALQSREDTRSADLPPSLLVADFEGSGRCPSPCWSSWSRRTWRTCAVEPRRSRGCSASCLARDP